MYSSYKYWRMVMEELHLPDNIKVHFAGSEVQTQYVAVKELGVQYTLYTAFPFLERMLFDKPNAPLMPLVWQKNNPFKKIPGYITENSKHVIQDSGLFTLMFGSQKGQKDESFIQCWYEALVQFTSENAPGVTCVEVDCQKVLGVEKAWEYRKKMKDVLPNNRIINVFHIEDGWKGLDRLIEFSEYIAISVPELRFAGKKNFTYKLANYIKNKKPEIDIHLLGCTEKKILKQCRFCTSADSTTYIAGKRFGFIKGRHISRIKTQEVQDLVGFDKWNTIREYNNEINTNFLCLSIEVLKKEYQQSAGNQDYLI